MITYFMLGGFLLGTLALGLWAGKDVKTMKDYVLANRSLSTGVLTMTLLATFVGSGDLENPRWTHLMGIINNLELLGVIFTCFVLGFWIAPKLVYFPNCLTIGDLIQTLYGKSASIFTSVIAAFVCTIIATGQIVMLNRLSFALLGINQKYFMLICVLVLTIYMMGGIRAVAYTDVVQFVALVSIITWIANSTIAQVGGIKPLIDQLRIHHPEKLSVYTHPDFSFFLKDAFFWGFFPTMFLTPPLLQRMLMAQDKRQVSNMFLGTLIFYPVLHILLALIGLAALFLNLNIAPSAPVLAPIIQKLFISDFAKGLIMIGLISVIVSTIDSFLHAAGVSIVHDILKPMFGKRIKKEITWIKGCTALLAFFACGLFLLSQASPTRIIFYGLAIFSLFVIPLLAGILGLKTQANHFWTAMLCALIGPGLLWFRSSRFLSTLISSTEKELAQLDFDIWLSAVITSMLGFFASHYITHKGFLFVQRSKTYSEEQLCLPRRKRWYNYLKTWFTAYKRLAVISRQKVYTYGSNPMLFAWFICIFYMIPSLEGSLASYSVVGLRLLGVVLCCGLLLKELWLSSLKPYFDLYWFFTLLYCLPFVSTLLFFANPESITSIVSIAIALLLLIVCVDSQTFFILSTLGTTAAIVAYRLVTGHFLPVISFDMQWNFVITVGSVLLVGLLFARRKQIYNATQLRKTKLYAGSIAHETKNYLGTALVTGDYINQAIQKKQIAPLKESAIQNKEAVYTIPKQFAEDLIELGPELAVGARQSFAKIDLFMSALKEDILSAKLKISSIKTCVQEALEDAYFKTEEVKKGLMLKLSDDFTASVPKDYFKHIIYNLVKNAYYHGGATQVIITLDAAKRTLSIEDNGRGIDSASLPHIFDLFYTGGSGSGIGLALVKLIVEACGASIYCASKQGQRSYTKFTVSFLN